MRCPDNGVSVIDGYKDETFWTETAVKVILRGHRGSCVWSADGSRSGNPSGECHLQKPVPLRGCRNMSLLSSP